jgi:hypothetical protein
MSALWACAGAFVLADGLHASGRVAVGAAWLAFGLAEAIRRAGR